MPHLDSKGPEGNGPGTGRCLGRCKDKKNKSYTLGTGMGKKRKTDDCGEGSGKRLKSGKLFDNN